MGERSYRCLATTPGGFVQQLAVQYVAHGYWFYVPGRIPEQKDPEAVDRKFIERYGLGISSSERARRKRAGIANVQYLRYGHTFVLVATHGRGRFFEEERRFRDFRRQAFRFEGYSISHRSGRPSVRIDLEEYRRLKAWFLELACHRRAADLVEALRQLPFEPYAPVRGQFIGLLRAVNNARATAGFEPVPFSALRLRRRIYRPFEPQEAAAGDLAAA